MKPRTGWSVMILAGVMVLATACGSNGASGNATASTNHNGSALSQAQALVRSAEKVPTFSDTKPAKPAPPFKSGLHLAIVNANAKSAAAALQVQGIQAAASAVGWTTQEFDGMGTNGGKIAAFRNALSLHPDGIVLVAVDQRIVSDPMQQAAAAGIPVVSTLAGNDQGTSPTQVFADLSGNDTQDGRAVASWIVADAAAHHTTPQIIRFEYPINNTVIKRDNGIDAVLSACGSCKTLTTVQYSSANLGQLAAEVAPAVEAHATANYVIIDIGAYASYVVKSIDAMGGDFSKNIKLLSFDCVADQIARIKAGDVEAACDGQASVYSGWGAIDELNRAMHHQPAQVEHVPDMLITKASPANVTDETGFNGGYDFAAAWKKFWGIQ